MPLVRYSTLTESGESLGRGISETSIFSSITENLRLLIEQF